MMIKGNALSIMMVRFSFRVAVSDNLKPSR